jgi:transcriptional regulator PpsR
VNRGPRTPSADTPLLPRDLDAVHAQRLIEAAGDLSLVMDGGGIVLDVLAHDREFQKTSRREWRGRPWADTVTVESRAKVQALLDGALADVPSTPRQVNHPMKAGPDTPMLYSAVCVAGDTRSLAAARVVAVGRDLRDTVALQRRLVEAQQTMEREYWRFREAETRYRTLFQSSAEAVLIVDGTTLRVLEANPAAQTLIPGPASRPGLVGTALGSLFAAAAGEPLSAAVAAARSMGKHDPLAAGLAGSRQRVSLSISLFRQDGAAFLLVRLAPLAAPVEVPARRSGAARSAGAAGSGPSNAALESAFMRGTTDALVFTDTRGRVVTVNRAFARLAQLSSEDQARGETLDRWVGRTGVELSVLLANLREGGSAGLFVTELRGTLGLVTEVEIAASVLDEDAPAAFAFALRDVGRRFAPNGHAQPSRVPASAEQLGELVGRVPLKQIVAETSDLIERLSIETALAMTRDNRAMAAQLLGLSRQSLYVKLRRFGLGGLDSGADDD